MKLLYPPGGLVVWFFVILELFTFGVAFVMLMVQGAADPETFHASRLQLDVRLATLNTAVLVTSGALAARAVAAHHAGLARATAGWLRAAAGLGGIFVLLKAIEYRAKLAAGHGMGANLFFGFYWGLTGFHLLHVLLGIGILLYFAARVGSDRGAALEPDLGVETGCAFWHLCDLIWVLLFPLVYLSF